MDLTPDAPWATPEQHRRLVRLCTILTGDRDAADDLAQETLATAWRLRHRLIEPEGGGAWLDAIARNVCRRHRSRRARERGREDPGEAARAAEAVRDPLVDLLERQELVELLDRALSLLPAETRDVLVARYVDELTPGEIAGRAGCSADAVSMRLVRGRTRLRHLLEDELRDDPAAAVWLGRHGAAWRRTRLRCQVCGCVGMEHRRDRSREVVELRCPTCSRDVASCFSLANPTLGPLLSQVSRPGAVLARMAAWSAGYWSGDGTGRAPCTRCGAAVPRAAYTRPDAADARSGRGWRVACAHCGEEQTASLTSIALVQPPTRSLPEPVALPVRREVRDGWEVEVVGFRDRRSGRGVDVHFSAGPDARLLAVVTG